MEAALFIKLTAARESQTLNKSATHDDDLQNDFQLIFFTLPATDHAIKREEVMLTHLLRLIKQMQSSIKCRYNEGTMLIKIFSA